MDLCLVQTSGRFRGRMELGASSWAFALSFPDGLLRNNYNVEWDTLVVKYDLGFAEMLTQVDLLQRQTVTIMRKISPMV